VRQSSVKVAVKTVLSFGHRRIAAGHGTEAAALMLYAMAPCAVRTPTVKAPRPVGRPCAVLGHASQATPDTVGLGQQTALHCAC
jgi:hypothetical protein